MPSSVRASPDFLILTDPKSKGVDSLALRPGGTTVAAGDLTGARMCGILPPEDHRYPHRPERKGLFSVAFGPGGTILAVADENGSTYLWKIMRYAP
jgi:hypothetical protein